jgi:hypothetical protein
MNQRFVVLPKVPKRLVLVRISLTFGSPLVEVNTVTIVHSGQHQAALASVDHIKKEYSQGGICICEEN